MSQWRPQSAHAIDLKVVLLGSSSVGKTSLVDRRVPRLAAAAARRVRLLRAPSLPQRRLRRDAAEHDRRGVRRAHRAGTGRPRRPLQLRARNLGHGRRGALRVPLTRLLPRRGRRRHLLRPDRRAQLREGPLLGPPAAGDLLFEGRERAVLAHEVDSYARELRAMVLETSAKTGHNVEHLFTTIASEGAARRGAAPRPETPGLLNLRTPPPPAPGAAAKGGMCC